MRKRCTRDAKKESGLSNQASRALAREITASARRGAAAQSRYDEEHTERHEHENALSIWLPAFDIDCLLLMPCPNHSPLSTAQRRANDARFRRQCRPAFDVDEQNHENEAAASARIWQNAYKTAREARCRAPCRRACSAKERVAEREVARKMAGAADCEVIKPVRAAESARTKTLRRRGARA